MTDMKKRGRKAYTIPAADAESLEVIAGQINSIKASLDDALDERDFLVTEALQAGYKMPAIARVLGLSGYEARKLMVRLQERGYLNDDGGI